MEKKYKETKKKYNMDKTFIQISKELHLQIKKKCEEEGIKVKDFIEQIIKEKI